MNRRRLTAAGLAVVLAAAAVLSFDALRGLALAVSIPARLAWLLPVAVDAGAAVSCATWLGRGVPREAARYAAGMTWALLGVTVLGNAGQLGMHAHGITPPWWVAVAVGTIPPAVVGATVHLLVLVTRGDHDQPVQAPTLTLVDPKPARVADAVAARTASPAAVAVAVQPTAEVDDLLERARELLADGAGRPQLRAKLGITDHKAKQLVKAVRG